MGPIASEEKTNVSVYGESGQNEDAHENADHKNKHKSVAKPSGAIQINSTPISMIQRKAWNLLLFNAFRDLKNKTRYTISINDLSKALGYKDTEQLKDSLRKLISTPIEFNVLKSKDKTAWEIMTLLSVATIENNVLTYGYVDELLQKLVDRPIYSRINIEIMKLITSKYALILYELACDHIMLGKGKGITPEITTSELQKLFGCEDNMLYKDFRYFNRDILKKAINEVNDKTDVHVEAKPIRMNKKIYAVQFQIKNKEDRLQMLKALTSLKQPELSLAPGGILYDRLVKEYELTDNQARKIINSFDESHIKERLIWVTQNYQMNTKKAYNLGALTYWAITAANPFQPPPADEPAAPALEIKDGMLVDIGNGDIRAVESGNIRYDRKSSIPYGEIRKGIQEGRFKVITNQPEPPECVA